MESKCEMCDKVTGIGHNVGNSFCCLRCWKIFQEFFRGIVQAKEQGIDFVNLIRELGERFGVKKKK